MSEMKQKPVCPHCDSDDISVDAAARWDMEKQEYVLSDVHEAGGCGHCQSDFKYPEWEAA